MFIYYVKIGLYLSIITQCGNAQAYTKAPPLDKADPSVAFLVNLSLSSAITEVILFIKMQFQHPTRFKNVKKS